ncbi:MAG: TIGR02996 domain-containing protein [Myxococcota bacterium]
MGDASASPEAARRALAGGDFRTALQLSLEAWRAARCAEISAAVRWASDRARSDFTPPKERTALKFSSAWRAALGDIVHRAWALESVLELLPGKDSDSKCEALLERLRALEQLEGDPRIAARMLALVELDPPLLGFTEVREVLGRVLVRHGDGSLRGPLLAVLEKSPRETGLREVVDALPAEARLAGDVALAWRALLPSRPKPSGEAPWEAAVTARDDDGPRAVLADWLLEHGDVRGEFIALQLKEARGEASEDEVKRAAALLAEHRVAWLGEVARIVHRAEFRRGFLHTLELAGSWSLARQAWAQVTAAKELETVEVLEPGEATGPIYAPFVASPVLAQLRRVVLWEDVTLAALEERLPASLRGIEVRRWKRFETKVRLRERVLPLLERLESLDELAVPAEFVELIPPARLAKLKWLGADGAELRHAKALLEQLAPGATLRVASAPAVELRRRGGEVEGRVFGPLFFKGIAPELAKNLRKAGVTRVEVVGHVALTKELEKACGPKLPVTWRPQPSGVVTGLKK